MLPSGWTSDGSGKDEKVIIVGGGLVGALAGIYMSRLGYSVHVYEKRPDMRKEQNVEEHRSINLALSVRGLTALKGVGLDQRVLELALPMEGRYLHMKDCTTFILPYGTFGECIYSVSRRLLNELLLEEAEAVGVKFYFERELESMKIDSDDGKVTMEFLEKASQRSTKVKCDFVLGCDGAYSRVRSELIKLDLVDFHQTYIEHGYKEFSMFPAEDDGSFRMSEKHLHIWPRRDFMLIALPNPHTDFEKLKVEEEVVAFFQENFADALKLMGADRVPVEYVDNPTGSLVTIRCSKYHYEDKILLLGDAAHAMVPFYGQGMNSGFEDLTVLTELFKSRGVSERSEIFSEYSRIRRPDAHAVCDLALYNYWEMSSGVINRLFLLRRSLHGLFHRLIPTRMMMPLYSMVAFSTIPYSEVVRRHALQEIGLNVVLAGVGLSLLTGLQRLIKKFYFSRH